MALTNPIAFTTINNAFATKRMTHAYLLNGPRHYQATVESLFLIQKLISANGVLRDPLTYADLTTIDGASDAVGKSDITSAIEKMNQSALGVHGMKVLWIKNVENSSHQSLNALLKFIEEPPQNTYIICTTGHLGRVLTTIQSRMQVISLHTAPPVAIVEALLQAKIKDSQAKVVAALNSSIEGAMQMAHDDSFWQTYMAIKNIMNSATHNATKMATGLFDLITRHNFIIVAKILTLYINDMQHMVSGMPLILGAEHATIEVFINNHFLYHQALYAINSFIVHHEHNANFDLAKCKFIIELERCYE